ncbi:MAG: hypothetical protein HC882_01320 [Acidobacteria bacterium]|nr:hypothetical protein [Acidobacteriota bacterium]
MPGGTKSVSNANHVDADGSVLDDFHTQDYNRMNWIQTGQNFQLGLGTPEFEYWTQLSILDHRLFGGGGFAFDAALNYICVDKNNNNECDTGQQPGGANNGEFWEPIRSAFSPENTFRLNNFINCMFDPSDDGTTEDQFFPNAGSQGPSSTCFPGNPVMTCVGRTREDDTGFGIAATVLTSACWPETGTEDAEIGEAGAVKGFGGDAGTWVRKTFRLEPWRGQKVLFRWHQSPGGLPGIENGAGFAAWQFGNRDDGWWIDNVAVRGLVNDFNLTLDNDGPVVNTCATTANCTSVNSVVAVLPYPRNDRNGLPKPAIYCTSQTTAECDFDENGVVDTSATLAQSDAPGRAFYIDARFSDADRCLGGAIEYRLLDLTGGTVVRDWVTDPLVLVNPSTTTSYRVETRCSSDFGCSDAADFVIDVPGSGPVDCRTSSLVLATNKQNITWAASPQGACPALFDTLRGTTTATGSGFTSGTCLENDGADTSSLDAGTPSLGTAFWYLARHAGDTYATGSAGEQDRSGITGCP